MKTIIIEVRVADDGSIENLTVREGNANILYLAEKYQKFSVENLVKDFQETIEEVKIK